MKTANEIACEQNLERFKKDRKKYGNMDMFLAFKDEMMPFHQL